ncbi:MAG: Wzz/FepE/Etk N-terminal domain-containing protein [Deferrisomatales bacterium]
MHAQQQSQKELQKYLRLFWRWKWLLLAPSLLAGLGAVAHSLTLSDRFRSSTLIMVQPQKVPEKFVSSTVTTDLQDRLSTISQQTLSRTRLEQVIAEFGLFQDAKADLSAEERIFKMRERIKLQVHASNRRSAEAFEVSYEDSSPRTAMLITAKLASLFIEENLKVREQQAMGTSQFLSDEIDRYRSRVRELESKVNDFKRLHMNELSEQLTSNQARLTQLQSQLQINTQSANAAEDRRMQLQQQLAEIERRVQQELQARREERQSRREGGSHGSSISEMLLAQFQQMEPGGETSVDDSKLRALEEELAKRRQAMEGVLISLTPKHPDVARLQGEVAKLEKRTEEERRRVEGERQRLEEEKAKQAAARPAPLPPPKAAPEPEPEPAPAPKYPPAYDQIKADLLRVEAGIARLAAQDGEIQKGIEVYQRRIAASSTRDLELRQLSEEYTNLKSVLNSLVDKKLQADLSENMERKQKGEQFQILDPANLPEKPVAPNRLRLVVLGFGGGFGLGLGIVLLLEFLNPYVRTKDEVVALADLPVLAVIPRMVTPDDLRRSRARRLTAAVATAACLVLAAGGVHWGVKPLDEAAKDLYSQLRTTHWTVSDPIKVRR